MNKHWKIGAGSIMTIVGIGAGVVATDTDGLDTRKSGKNHNRTIEIQNGVEISKDTGKVGIAFYSNSSFQLTSPKGVSILVDTWRNDPSGAWGFWYRMEFPQVEVDIGISPHSNFDHDALGRLEANMLLDRMAGKF